VPTGNGTFDAASKGRDYGDSVLKLALNGSALKILDYFTPYDQARMEHDDGDLGSSGPLLLPDQQGPHAHLILQPSKNHQLYIIDRDEMGQFHPGEDAIVQKIGMPEGFGAMAYWNHHVFFAGNGDELRDYVIEKGVLTLESTSGMRFEDPGATPTVSANGEKNAIVWAIATRFWNGVDRPAVLYAFNPNKMDQPIYTSEQNSSRDRAALATRFVIPIVIHGRVYFSTRGEVEVYGLLK
jgi:hypothetical protein